MTTLLGIDFGSPSLGAARWATRHVAPEADATALHVVPAEASSFRELVPALTGGLGGFTATLGVPGVRNLVRQGSPSRWLSVVAAELRASLLVLGRRRDSHRTCVGEPNVIERAARRSESAVLVVPEGTVAPPSHIIAAVDESGFAFRVLAAARRLARMHGIPLVALHVPVQQDATKTALGDPACEIVAAASQNQSSLVIVGMRGADGAPRGSLGSVTRELLTRATMPVLAVND